ncbi:putative CDP-alcohol phosphatidyltransferase class-I family protein C22A12.10 [Pseudocercospora fuligena]|uniref:diacylglycerol cholinephosphotransferase n=1 Tax=Pseudocercospora fuligena TaxID=685502 RepID=A0A8H6RRR1_9PEZI|nr:putative CDP-alcohol phosphatidyltransferase class-I family protein C22A12.10 [Pseudocercospora fuligena]
MGYIRVKQLEKLKEYKYSSVDRSLISQYVLKPYWWSQVIKLFPLSMAPNAITLSGFGFVIANILTMLYYTPTLDQDCPSWVYLSWSIGLFLYQTFDAIDGSQARRTRQSGPLGELFDHGVDALNTSLEVLLFAAAMQFGQGWRTVLVLFACLLTFYVQTWDEYHTKTLTLGLVSGPVEGILTLCVVYAITAYTGGSYWQQPMLHALGVPHLSFLPDLLYEMDFGDFYMVYGGLVLVFTTIESSRNVMRARRERGEQARVALLGLLPFFGSWALIASYLALQPNILHNHLIPFVLYVGLINAYSVGQMITAHLTKSPFPYQNILALPLIYGILDSLGEVLLEKIGLGWYSSTGDGVYQVAFVFTCLGLAVGVYGSFVVDVIVSICDTLDIWCLTIKHPYTAETESTDKKTVDAKKAA